MSKLIQMPVDQFYSEFEEFSDSDSRVLDCQEIRDEPFSLGAFLLALAFNIGCWTVIIYGVARAIDMRKH